MSIETSYKRRLANTSEDQKKEERARVKGQRPISRK